jgi:hypothetical protein
VPFRRAAALLLSAALAGCVARAPEPKPAALPVPQLLDPETACLQDLARVQAVFEPMQSFGNQGSCGVSNPVRMSGTPVPLNRPAIMSCRLARTLVRYEQEVLNPLAMRNFGQPIKRIHHAGTYDCRPKRNDATKAAVRRKGNSLAGNLSEHSKGTAIDLIAFELADGTTVSVKRDWRGKGKQGAFLREAAAGSCSLFNVVLTPNHDRWHQDHFHLDIGPYALCGN